MTADPPTPLEHLLIRGSQPNAAEKIRHASELLYSITRSLSPSTLPVNNDSNEHLELVATKAHEIRALALLFAELLNSQVEITDLVKSSRSRLKFPFGELITSAGYEQLTQRGAEFIEKFNGRNEQPLRNYFYEALTDCDAFLSSWRVEEIDRALRELVGLRVHSPNDLHLRMDRSLEDYFFSRRTHEVDELAQQARQTVEDIRNAGQVAGSGALAVTYNEVAKVEDGRSRFWTACVFACIFGGIALPITVLSIESFVISPVSGWFGVIIKMLTGFPLFAAAAYCARIAAQHRETSRHLRILTAQMGSVNAYVSRLPKETQDDIVATLGKRAFANPDLSKPDDGKLSVIPEGVLPLLEKAMDIAKDVVKKDVK